MSDSEQSTNTAEYSYEKTLTGADRLKRVLYVCGVILIMLIPLIIAAVTQLWYVGIVGMPLFVFLGVPLAKFFFRYLQAEYKYTVERSSFKMELIHGKAKPKLLYQTDVRDIEFAAPATEENKQKYNVSDADKTAYCWISGSSPDLYMMIFKDGSGKRVLLYFEGCRKALKIMNYYNKNVEVSNDLMH